MRELEKEKIAQMEKILSEGITEPDYLVNLFSNSVQEEMAIYGKSWENCTFVWFPFSDQTNSGIVENRSQIKMTRTSEQVNMSNTCV